MISQIARTMLEVSTDKTKLVIPFIQNFLKDIYWSAGRTIEEVQITIDASVCFGLYLDGKQIGFARGYYRLCGFCIYDGCVCR